MRSVDPEGRLGQCIVHLAEAASTMDEARELAQNGEPEGTVVWADRQSGGRGRDGRAWASPEGGLWFSVILRPRVPPASWSLLPLMGGVAVAVTLRARGVDAGVKWPNDVLLADGRKVAGVLCESRLPTRAESGGSGMDGHVVMGLGVNVNVRPDALAPDVRSVAGSLLDHGGPHDVAGLMGGILRALGERYALHFQSGRPAAFLDEYRALSVTLGRRVRPREGPEGLAVDVQDTGALVVERANGMRVVVPAGDVDVAGRER